MFRSGSSPSTAPEKEFAQLYEECAGKVRSVLYKMCPQADVDDLVQETFVKIWKAKDSFRGESSRTTWATRIAVNVANDFHRSKGHREHVAVEEEMLVTEVATESPADKFQEAIMNCLEKLSQEHRSVLVLTVLEEHSLEEAAEILEIPVGTVKSRLFHAKKDMKKYLSLQGVKYE